MKTFLFFFFMLFYSTIQLDAVTDCFDGTCTGSKSTWQPLPGATFTPLVVNFGGCSFLVNYKWRICDGPPIRRELDILGITAISGCQGIAFTTIMNEAIKQALWEANSIFSVPDPGVNPYEVYIGTKPCWINTSQPGFPPILVPCNEPPERACCITKYTMQIIDDSVVTLAQTTIQQNFNCQLLSGYECGENVCSANNVDLNVSPVPRLTACPCDGVPWSNNVLSYTGNYPGGNTCSLRVYYHTRFCDGAIEFYMYRVELLGNCNAQSPPTVEDYLKKAIKILVFNIALNNGGNVTLRRRMPPCWKRVGNILIPCNFQNCCVKEYVMAYDPPASVRVVSVTPPPIDLDCDALPGCDRICNDNIIANTPLPRISIGLSDENQSKPFSSYVKPNPAGEKIEVYLTSPENGSLILKIYNNLGSLVYSTYSSKNSGEFKIEIDVSPYNQGLYNYIFELNGQKASSGKFIITK